MKRLMTPSSRVALIVLLAGCGAKAQPPAIPSDGGREPNDSGAEVADAGLGARDAADLGVAEDSGPADVGPVDTGALLRGIGDFCRNDFDCPRSGICLNAAFNWNLSSQGYCTSFCDSDDDCGEGVCGSDAGLGRFCLLPCGPDRSCPDPRHLCNDRVGGYVTASQPVCFVSTATASPGDPCRSFSDCNINSVCINNYAEFPGGACIGVGCEVGNDPSCAPLGGGTCRDREVDGPVCLPACTVDADCRTDYFCGGGTCLPSFPYPGVGAPCQSDAACGPGPWRCLTGPDYPGGFCTTMGCAFTENCGPYVCPSPGSCRIDQVCHDPTPQTPRSGDDYCAWPCGTDADCRGGNAGYACLLALPPVTTASICR